MITVEKALQIVLDHTRILEPTNVPILQAMGMVLAEDIVSSEDIPPYDTATIEGFALRSANIANSDRSRPTTLVLDGEVKVGVRWEHIIQSGHALKVAAGAPLPDGAEGFKQFGREFRHVTCGPVLARVHVPGSNDLGASPWFGRHQLACPVSS